MASRTRKPRPTMGTTSNSVSNVANTGQLSTSRNTTGATGDVRNTTNSIEIHGTPGTPGREVSATISLPDVPPHTYPESVQPGMTVHAPPEAAGAVNDALDHAQTHLTNARAQVESALASIPAEYQAQVRAQVDAGFARGTEQISNARKRYTT
jgi:hypothetical protein